MIPDDVIAQAYAEYYLTLRPVSVVFDGESWSVRDGESDDAALTLRVPQAA